MEHVENKASKNIIEDNIEKLKALFPEAFTESSVEGEPRWKVDFETLKQILGDYTEESQANRPGSFYRNFTPMPGGVGGLEYQQEPVH